MSKTKKQNTFTKVSMNLNERSMQNVNRLSELTSETNKTRCVSIALEIARQIIEMSESGERIITRKGDNEKELTFIF